MSEQKPEMRDIERQSSGTTLESVEQIRQAIKEAQETAFSPEKSQAMAAAQLFRPRNRPPMAVLSVRFDGDDEGQEIAVFSSPFVIGRVEGDLVIAHDTEISARHAELIRVFDNGRYFWQLNDLKSTNGTFVRAGMALLKDHQEILLGSQRFRFESGSVRSEVDQSRSPSTRNILKSRPRTEQQPMASLVTLDAPGKERRFSVTQSEHWIGRDPRLCSIVLDDPTVSPRHARLYRDKQNRWLLANAKSLNGVWLRINRIELGHSAHFQLGEQRFSIRIP